MRSPTVANGILYATSNDHRIYALITSDGRHIWNIYTYKGFYDVTFANGADYATSGDGNIYALNAESGTILWKHDTTPPEFKWVNSSFQTTPVYGSGLLFFTCRSEQHIQNKYEDRTILDQMTTRCALYALEATTGNKVWNTTFLNTYLAVTVDDGVIYTKEGSSLFAFNSQNGILIWNYTISILEPKTKPVVVNGVLYESFQDGQMYALEPKALGLPEVYPFFIIIGGQVIGLDLLVAIVLVVILIVILLLFLRKHYRKRDKELL
jgi:outer membrane protein assembly factor BamB